jgi:hypothetical protein
LALELCIAISVTAVPARAATAFLGHAFGTATRDTMIFQNNLDNGAGGAPGFFVGANAQPSPRRGLIEFDLSTLPTRAVVTAVELRLVIGQRAGSGGGANPPGYLNPVIGLHRLLVPWGEADTGRSTANVLNGTGQGTPAQVGDATWNSRYHDPAAPTEWIVPGGQAGTEFATTASAANVQANELYAESIWPSTPELVADVQDWLADPATNHGWMLINTNETDRQALRGFFSHDYNPASLPIDLPADSELNEPADFWPVLTVVYDTPLAGDFDGDGDVDGSDFLAWQRNPLLGSLADWQADYGGETPTTEAFAAVPEPATLLLCVLTSGLLVSRRDCRH